MEARAPGQHSKVSHIYGLRLAPGEAMVFMRIGGGEEPFGHSLEQ
jgi:hypothetical protein